MTKFFVGLLAVVVIEIWASSASATTYLYEPFDYGSGASLISPGLTDTYVTPNRTWLQAGTSAATTGIKSATNDLTAVTGLSAPVGNEVKMTGSGDAASACDRLALTSAFTSSGTLYYSFLLRFDASTGSNNTIGGFFFSLNNTGNSSQTGNPTVEPGRVQARIDPTDASKYSIEILTNHGAASGDSTWYNGIVGGQTYLIVGALDYNGTNTTAARLWVNPAQSSYGSSTVPTADRTDSTSNAVSALSSVLLRQNVEPWLTIDEIRVASTWAEVTPSTAPLYWDINGATAGSGGPTPSGTWDTSTSNWNPGSAGDGTAQSWVSGANAIFSAGSDATGAYTVTISGTQTAGTLTFKDGTPTLTGGTLNLSGAASLVSNTGVTATVASVVGGSSGLVKDGAGTVVLTGNETYTGTTTISAGALQLGGGGATGSLPTGSTITNNGTLVINRSDNVSQGAVGGSTTIISGSPITGTGGFTQAGSGTTTLTAANTFTGTTRATNGTLQLNNSLALQNSTLDMNTADTGSVVFDSSLSAVTLGGLTGTRNLSMLNSASGTLAVTVGNNNTSPAAYTGVLSGSGSSLTKVGTGAQTLSGANTYDSGSTINAGTLQFGQTNAMPVSGTVTVNLGGTLGVNAGGAGEWANSTDTSTGGTLGSLIAGRGGQGAANQVTWADGSAASGFAALAIDTTNAPTGGSGGPEITYSGNIGGFHIASGTSDKVGLTKRGTGTLFLSRANTFTGPLSVANNGGTLAITSQQTTAGQAMTIPTVTIGNAGIVKVLTNDALPTNSLFSFGSSSPFLQLYNSDPSVDPSFNQTVRGLSGGNGHVQVGLGTFTDNVPTGETYSYTGVMITSHVAGQGAGTFVKNGAGEQDFTQDNNGSGGHFILNAGTIGIGDQGIFGHVGTDYDLTINGGTLKNITTSSLNPYILTVYVGGSFAMDSTPGDTQWNGQSTAATTTHLTTANPTITVTNATGGTLIYSGNIVDDGNGYGFTKDGPGTLTLGSPNNNYTGTTTIKAGFLRVRKQTNTNNIGTARIGDGTGAVNLSGGTLEYNGSVITTGDARTITVSNPINVTATASGIRYASTTLTLGTTNNIEFLFTSNSISSTGGDLTFSNAGSCTDNSNTCTFTPTFSGDGFNFGAPVIINNQSPTVTRSTVLRSTNGTGTTQTWSGDMTGTGTYLRDADGTTVLGGSNISVKITNNSNIIFSRATAQAYSGAMSGTGNVTKSGTGTLTLSGNSSYSGSTEVGNGTMLVNGSLTGTTGVLVDSGATLGGTGTISAAVTNNGKLAPGASIGTLTTNTLMMNSGSELDLELGAAPTTGDKVNITATGDGSTTGLILSGGSVVVSNAGGMASGTYPVLDYAGTLGGLLSNLGTPTGPSGFTYALQNDATNTLINLIVTATTPPGDYNGDTKINAADYVTWRKDPTSNGGANGYATWRENFSQSAGAGPNLGDPAAVPEPGALSLVLLSHWIDISVQPRITPPTKLMAPSSVVGTLRVP